MLSTLQDEACNEEEREVQEYDGDVELVIPFLTLLKEMSGFFFFFAVNSTSLFVLQVYTGCWVLYSLLPHHTIPTYLRVLLQICENDQCNHKNDGRYCL